MAGSLGSLVVSIEANTAKFASDMGRTAQIAENNMRLVQESVDRVKSALATLGVGLSVVAFTDLIKGSIDAADRLQDLSKKTGIAVEALGGIGLSAKQSGLDLESVSNAISKLNKSIGEALGGNKEFINDFAKLGVVLKDSNGNVLSTDKVLAQLADRFASFEEGPIKGADAIKIFGKSGADIIPLLDDGGKQLLANIDYYKKYSGVTAESAARADAFNDSLDKLKLLQSAFAQNITSELLPGLQAIVNRLIALRENSESVQLVFSGLRVIFETVAILTANVAFVLAALGREIGAITAQLEALSRLDLKGYAAISDAVKADGVQARKELDQLEKDILSRNSKIFNAPVQQAAQSQKKIQAPIFDASGIAKDDPTNKILEQALKAQEQYINSEKNLLATRNKFLDLYYGENVISIQDYYKAKNAIEQENLQKTIAAYDKEISALEAVQAKRKKQTEKADDQIKINDLLAKRNQLQQQVTEDSIINSVQESKALRDYQDSINGVNAQILELTGNLKEAALIRFDQQNKSLVDRFTAEGNTQAIKQLQTLRDYAGAQAAVNKLIEDADRAENELANTEARITLSQKVGAISEIGALSQTSIARQKTIEQLQAIYDKQEQIAQASGNPKLLQDADNLKLKIDELIASSDLLAEKFNTIFTDSFSSAFSDFVTGAKSASDAFKAFADSVVSQIARIAAQNIANDIFGSAGTGGGNSGVFSGIGSFFADLFGGARAGGGNVDYNKAYMVGENGPEMFLPGSSGTIIPNGSIGSNVVHIHQNFTGQQDPRTMSQGARDAGVAVQRAMARNN